MKSNVLVSEWIYTGVSPGPFSVQNISISVHKKDLQGPFAIKKTNKKNNVHR